MPCQNFPSCTVVYSTSRNFGTAIEEVLIVYIVLIKEN